MSRCDLCTRPTHDTATICTHCGITTPDDHLRSIHDHLPAAIDRAYGHTSHPPTDGTRPPGKPESRMPINLTALSRLDATCERLNMWASLVTRHRTGGTWVPPYRWYAATWLRDHLEWMRHRADAAHFYEDLAAADRLIRGLANGRPERRYLGPCGAAGEIDTSMATGPMGGIRQVHVGLTCNGDVYTQVGDTTGHCNTCGTRYPVAARRQWLDDVVRDHLFTASEISAAYPIKRNTINQWAARGRLTAKGMRVRPRPDTPIYRLGDVLDLAAADAARREARP